MKTAIRKTLLSATMVVSAGMVWAFTAPPVFDRPIPPHCPGAWELEIASVNDEFQFENPVRSQGSPIFGATEVVRSDDQPAYVQRSFENLDGRGYDERLGEINWTIDRERQAQAEDAGLITTVRANQFDSDLPASADIRFFVNVTLSSRPGEIFRSAQQVRFVSDHITSYPFENEEIRIAEPVDFYDESGQVVFRIEGGRGTATSE